MAQHVHDRDTSYEFHGSTYRACSDPACRAHQQWVRTLDRCSDTLKVPSPRRREAQRVAEREAASPG